MFIGPTFGPSGADRIQMGLVLAPWNLLSGQCQNTTEMALRISFKCVLYFVNIHTCYCWPKIRCLFQFIFVPRSRNNPIKMFTMSRFVHIICVMRNGVVNANWNCKWINYLVCPARRLIIYCNVFQLFIQKQFSNVSCNRMFLRFDRNIFTILQLATLHNVYNVRLDVKGMIIGIFSNMSYRSPWHTQFKHEAFSS